MSTIEEYIERVVATVPPLTDDQRQRLAALFRQTEIQDTDSTG